MPMHHLLVMSTTAVSTMSTAVISVSVIPSRYIRMFATASTNFGVTNYDYIHNHTYEKCTLLLIR